MRLSLAFAALCAVPALAGVVGGAESNNAVFARDPERDHGRNDERLHDHHHGHRHKNHGHHRHSTHHDHGVSKHHHKTHKHKHSHLHPHYHHHHHHHKHPIAPCHILTESFVCKQLHLFADIADQITHVVQTSDCGQNIHCWKPIRDGIYKLEHDLDVFDKHIDHTTLQKCFNCNEEATIADCYNTYANALIRLLKVIKEKSKYLEGEIDRPILTAVNSLQAADYTFVHELGRRIHCKDYLKIIMRKQGATDGTTQDSIREAFSSHQNKVSEDQNRHYREHHYGKEDLGDDDYSEDDKYSDESYDQKKHHHTNPYEHHEKEKHY
ncbi:hypothetical protein ACJZ2D_004998 [Fusarium nematophilum]